MHRFILDIRLRQGHASFADRALVHQLKRVLHVAAGESVLLCDGAGEEAAAKLITLTTREATFDVGAPMHVAAEPQRRVTLYCAVLKREHMDTVCQKATEAGVHAVVPLVSARTVKTAVRLERLRLIAKEAAEQSGRGRVPSIVEPMTFAKALEEADCAGVLFAPAEKRFDPRDLTSTAQASVWIGPEGGWESREVAAGRAKGLVIAGLGPLILRAETAAAIAAYLVVNA